MDLIFFNFSEGGNIENERIIEVSQININSSNSEKEKCEFHIETLKKIDVVNNETFFYFEESRELGGVITEYSKSGDVYKYKGKTFRGMIAERYIVPGPGYTHRIFPTAQSAPRQQNGQALFFIFNILIYKYNLIINYKIYFTIMA